MQRYITLLRVIDLQNITKAAQDMGYTQSAVSQMIQSLEKELQLTLVTRSRNGVRLTREGAELYPYITRMVNEYHAMMDKDKELLGLLDVPASLLPEVKPVTLGKYGSLRRNHLQNSKPYLYQELLLDGKLNEHLAEVDETAYEAFNRLVDRMSRAENVTERLKAKNQMLWVQRMNSIYDRAEEVILNDYIYN